MAEKKWDLFDLKDLRTGLLLFLITTFIGSFFQAFRDIVASIWIISNAFLFAPVISSRFLLIILILESLLLIKDAFPPKLSEDELYVLAYIAGSTSTAGTQNQKYMLERIIKSEVRSQGNIGLVESKRLLINLDNRKYIISKFIITDAGEEELGYKVTAKGYAYLHKKNLTSDGELISFLGSRMNSPRKG